MKIRIMTKEQVRVDTKLFNQTVVKSIFNVKRNIEVYKTRLLERENVWE